MEYFIALVFGIYALLFPLPFGAGFYLTIDYAWRALRYDKYIYRVYLWAASIIIQGIWLFIGMIDFVNKPQSFNPMLAWWAFAFVSSLIGLYTEDPYEHF